VERAVAGPMEAYEQLALQADLPPELSPITEGTGTGPTGDNFPDGVAETGCGMQSSALLAGESSLSGQYVGYHRVRDWATPTRNWPGRIFLIHGVNDQAARIASIYWFNQRGVRSGDKLWLGQWDHGIGCCPNQRGLQWTLALHSWFDHTLLERNVDTGPPVELFMNDANVDADAIEKRREVMTGTQWPPPASPLVLRADPGSKLIRGSAADGSASFEGNLDGYLENRHATGLDFVGEALAQDTIVAGVPEVTLSVAQTMPRLHLIAHVMDESPSGERRRISTCAIQPELREGIDKITPVIPGERMNVKPPCFATAHRFRARHKIVLKVATSSDDHIPTFAMDPNVTVYTGSDGTSVSLPVAQSPAMFPDKIDLKAKGFGGSGA
jgi:predicted acyl esterase